MLIIASIPAGLAGVLLADWVKGRLYQSPAVIASAFIIGGVAILMIERFRPTPVVFEADQTPVPRAFAVGVCQMLALVPGVSRSGATIMGGLLAGSIGPAAAEFSFFLAMPALAGGISARFVGGARPSGARARRGNRDRVRHGVSRRAGGREAVRALCGAAVSLRLRGTASWPAW